MHVMIGARLGSHHRASLRGWRQRYQLGTDAGALRHILDTVAEGIVVTGARIPSYAGKRGPALRYHAKAQTFQVTDAHLDALHALGLLVGETSQAAALRRLLDMAATDIGMAA